MTEQEWLSCTDPQPMLEFLKGKANDRKLRLFAVACCRRIQDMMTDTRNNMGVEITERYADGLASDEELAAATANVWAPVIFAAEAQAGTASWFAARAEAYGDSLPSKAAPWTDASEKEWTAARYAAWLAQAMLLRDIFGNPFRPITLDPSWLTPTVKVLAQKIYIDRTFDQLPILADELVKSGCANADILGHCREPGPHVRGCWVVDLVLGKELGGQS